MKKLLFFTIFVFIFSLIPVVNAAEIRDIQFPVDGEVHFTDTWGAARNAGRTHEGTDIMGEKMMPLIAAVDGVVTFLPIPEPSWGWGVWIRDAQGYEYVYLHVNNDTPGTDDGNGGVNYAFVPGVRQGSFVIRGQLIGWMGDSGNAEWTGAHLHFEIRRPDDTAINSYESLILAQGGTVDIPAPPNNGDSLELSTSIDDDKNLATAYFSDCTAGSLMKIESSKAVYYCGRDGKRYVFPNDKIYFSWFDDFDDVITVSDATLASVKIGGNVTYKPGTRLVKIQSDPKVYAVAKNGTLRWVSSASIAESMYGANWATQVDDIPVAFFVNYAVGSTITTQLAMN